ncbi:septation inhibitor protein [Bacillus sp. TS-2]|nr:septation inhibitor protein [Bacillus sp. TS-2]
MSEVSVMTQKKQHVTIKGTKDGLIFILDDLCEYTILRDELIEKLSSKHYQNNEGPEVKVRVHAGYRYLSKEQRVELTEIITNDKNLSIEKIESYVITLEEAEEMKQQSELLTLTRVVRSGQVLRVKGDLLLIGDVNPGGTIMATGNIYVMGALKGIAHAGFEGNEEAVITSSYLVPTQMRIADVIYKADNIQSDQVMEAAFINQETEEITIQKVQQLIRYRPHLQKNLHQIID